MYLNELETVPALYAYPEKEGPFPTVLYLHSHGGDFSVGKSELIHGAPYLASPSFAEVLTGMGYAVWSIDAWEFEERGGISESELFKQFLLTGKTLWGMRIYDVISLIDYLETREDTDTQRLATIGLSMGGLLSWWVTALDSRVKVCIDLAAQVDIETLLLHRRLDHHGFYYYVPNLLTAYTTLAIQEKIAPRPRLSLVGKNDTMCLDEGVLKLRKGLDKKYQSMGSPENFSSFSLTGGHMETQEMRNIWKQFIREHL
ncbi:hydrolase [Enterococcus faecium]|nr:hydrolase [Enterococcus faecium]